MHRCCEAGGCGFRLQAAGCRVLDRLYAEEGGPLVAGCPRGHMLLAWPSAHGLSQAKPQVQVLYAPPPEAWLGAAQLRAAACRQPARRMAEHAVGCTVVGIPRCRLVRDPRTLQPPTLPAAALCGLAGLQGSQPDVMCPSTRAALGPTQPASLALRSAAPFQQAQHPQPTQQVWPQALWRLEGHRATTPFK